MFMLLSHQMFILQKSLAIFLVTPTANFMASWNVFLIQLPTLSLVGHSGHGCTDRGDVGVAAVYNHR